MRRSRLTAPTTSWTLSSSTGRRGTRGHIREEAIRNYARNYAEASERLTGGTERLSEIGDVTVHPVSEDRVGDWLRLFDHEGFSGNPDWASCYCLEPHVPATPELPERPWRETRAAVAERLRCGRTFGYLAYVDDRPAGWVNASFRSDYGLYRLIDPDGPEPPSVIGVSCFVIAPPFRRHGIASALLDRVIADASRAGRRGSRDTLTMHPKPATQAISGAHGRCTTHVDSCRSPCGNMTRWCAGRFHTSSYIHQRIVLGRSESRSARTTTTIGIRDVSVYGAEDDRVGARRSRAPNF